MQKGGTQLRKLLCSSAWSGLFVTINNQRRLFTLFHRHRRYLGVKPAGLNGGRRFLLRAGGEGVLLLAGNVILAGDVFSGDPHVVIVECVPQAVGNHAVLEARMPET